MRRLRALSLVLALGSLLPRAASAQQRGTDVGGQPAQRKLTKMPKLLKFVEAEYPEEEKRSERSASVVLVLDVSATGRVTAVTVQTGAGKAFDEAATRAAMQFVLEPAEVDDKPAPSRITYRYDFVFAPPAREGPGEPTAPPPPAPPDAPAAPAPPAPPAAKPGVADEVTVRGDRSPAREAVDYRVKASEAKRVPGTQGDVLKVVQNLPGVSRPPLASGQIVVWGSAPRDTRVYVDGVDLPALYHGSGLRGTINSDLVSSIDLVPGAFGVEYGRGLGGLVRVETRALPRGTHGYVGADTLDGSAFVSTELGARARVGASLRYGWLDRVLTAASAPDVGDFFPIPRYRDAQLKVTFDLRPRETLDAVALYSADALERVVPSPDPAKRRSEATGSDFWRVYARYTSVSERGDVTTITPFFGQDSSRLAQRFGGTPARLDVDSDRYGVRASVRSPLGRRVALLTGLDTLGTAATLARTGSLSLPPREGDVTVFGQPPGDEYAADAWKTHVLDVAPNVHAEVKLGPVTFSPGVRFDAFLIEGSKKVPTVERVPPVGFSRLETALAPRAQARWDVSSRFALNGAAGTYHQAPEPEELSAVFGTPDLALSRATHVTIGESLRISESLSLDLVGFHKDMKDLVVRSRLANPLVARSLTQNGQGRSYGVQLLLRQELWKGFFGWASYAISKSERRYDGDLDWRAFDFDQPHVLSLVASQELGAFTVGVRFRAVSGNPRTPVIGSVYDARNDRYDPRFGPQNTTRIPTFWQLDVRVDRSFRLGSGLRLLLFADLQNVTNQQNAEEIVYTADFRRRDRIAGLPFLAVVGARLER